MIFKSIAFILVAFFLSFSCAGQDLQFQFGRIDMSKGLSNPIVNDIFEDSTGFKWFATASGLNRYDGHSIKVFKNIPGDSTSLDVDNLTGIFEGPEGKLWIRSYYGNVVYNPKTENFDRHINRLLNKYGIPDGGILKLKKDHLGRFWFLHHDHGLFCFDPTSKKTVNLFPSTKDTTTLATAKPFSMSEDSQGNMWVIHQDGTFERFDQESLKVTFRSYALRNKFQAQLFEYDLMIDADDDLWIYSDRNYGVHLFNLKESTFTHFHTGSAKGRLNSGIINKILQDDNKLIWIITENGGINLLDKKDYSVRYIQSDELDPKSPTENTGYSILKDRQGIVWIGYKNGVSFYHPDIFRFRSFTHKEGRPETLPFNDISALAEDKSGNLWLGTNGSGLIRFNRHDKTFTTYRNDPKNLRSLSTNIIVSLFVDHEDVLWIGTYYGGLNSFDGKTFTRYANKPGDQKSLGNDNIWEIYEDREHNLWLGTLNGGLDVYNRQKKEFYHYKSGDVNSIHSPYVPALLQTNDGNMLIGTGYGLEVLNPSSGRFIHYLSSEDDPKSISSNGIQCVFQDSRGWIWVGTVGGLNRFDYEKNEFSSFREQNGLAHNSILTIVEDREHNLWMSTPKGISKLAISPDGKFIFHNYTDSDGLIAGVYHENAALHCSSGELYFGGSGGLSVFNPGDIRIDSSALPVVLTNFQISNRPVKAGEVIDKKVILESSITQTDHITLYPSNNIFSIEFAALNYFHPERSSYMYRLEGFNTDWITTSSNNRIATFTNLDPGDYVFRVKGTNSDGVWSNQETQLHITVLPPFWKSNFAFVLYTLMIFGTLLLGRRLLVMRERLKYKIEAERLSAQRLHEVDELKIKFFTNVSHELRTPLTLIITPLEKIIKDTAPVEKRQLAVVHKNAKRLLNLVNQLLDFKRVDSADLKLNPSEGDIIKFIRDLVGSFSDLSEKKNIRLTFNSKVDSLETMFDSDKLEKIVFNLLSNAFKFTPDLGHVSVTLDVKREHDARMLKINVSDTGIGIPEDKYDLIFDRFYQSEVPKNMVNQGSGIGLSITQEFVKLHEGTIKVRSQVGKGSTFTVTIPIVDIHDDLGRGDDHLNGEENGVGEEGPPKTTILLVDDSDDFRSYLRDSLKNHYTILEAPNGKLGLEAAISHLPELVIGDVMMPEMDGIEMCKRIKEDARTSHIAVILLTARTAAEQKIEGFKSGANDYITKPFSFDILESRVENLISMRSLRHEQFQNHLDIKVSDIHVASADEKLVQDSVKVVEENLTNEEFSVEAMSRMLGMSRVHLYKKLYSLTGKTPIEFIRFIRIKRAAQLLEKSGLSVSEVAYKVGFNNPKYLAKYFRDVYGMLPSEFVAKSKTT